eukprot:CAMPEP_0170462092 /NCGR_PEP_ID=MMETSP0123-20130129/7732_1 /TAXON_ID=182087 /ORGANISM="Favella ehrenbergii, Strain Fehren 1" /LENGTH=49 /DNA_ID=CAMNT_0010727235 /DNA_START=543 /DNA_END=692 /DNA_ORIENTATION=-
MESVIGASESPDEATSISESVSAIKATTANLKGIFRAKNHAMPELPIRK